MVSFTLFKLTLAFMHRICGKEAKIKMETQWEAIQMDKTRDGGGFDQVGSNEVLHLMKISFL